MRLCRCLDILVGEDCRRRFACLRSDVLISRDIVSKGERKNACDARSFHDRASRAIEVGRNEPQHGFGSTSHCVCLLKTLHPCSC
jgi:hypothetical protein